MHPEERVIIWLLKRRFTEGEQEKEIKHLSTTDVTMEGPTLMLQGNIFEIIDMKERQMEMYMK